MQISSTLSRQTSIERIRKAFLLANGVLLTLMGVAGGSVDLVAYWTGNGPLGKYLFNAPFGVGFFAEHELTAFFGILLLTIVRSDPNPGWHLAAAALHLLSALGITIFWEGAVEWGVTGAEMSVFVLDIIIASAHLWLYSLARSNSRKG